MTVLVQTPVNSFTANGVTTVFNFTFLLLKTGDLDVYVNNILQTLGVNYSVSGLSVPAGGAITFTVAPTNAANVVIQRNSDLERSTDYQDNGDLLAQTINADIDRVWLALQELTYKYKLAPRLPAGSPLADNLILPAPQVGKYLRWNALENNLENADPGFYSGTVLPTSAIINTFADLAITPAAIAGMVVFIKQHTSSGVGGGYFQDNSGTISNNGGTLINNSVTTGRHWKRISCDALTVEDFGFYTTAANNNAAFANALAYNKQLIIPEGAYAVTATVTTNKSPRLIGCGDNSVIDFSGGGKLEIINPIVSIPLLSLDAVGGERALTFASAHGLAVNDIVLLYNPTDFSFSPCRDYYRDGVMLKVAQIVSSTVVYVYGIIPNTFAFASVNCFKLAGGAVKLDSFRIIPNAAGLIQIEIDGCVGVEINRVSANNGTANTHISVARSWGLDINASGSANLSDAYPISIANCQHGKITGDTNSSRHCITFGGFGSAGSVPCRDFIIYNINFENEGTLGIGAADSHGNSENFRFVNCTMKSGANLGGKNIYFDNCTVYGRPPSTFPDGNCVFGSEFVGGVAHFSNCVFMSWGSLASFGVIYADLNRLTENVIFKIDNCTFDSKAASVSGSILYFNVGSASPSAFRLDVHIDGFWFRSSNLPTSILAFTGTNDVSSKLSIIMDNIRANNGCTLVTAVNTLNLNASMRLPRMTNSVVLTLNSTSFQHIATTQNFRYIFPRLPRVHVSASSKDGAAQSGSISGKTVVPFARAYTVSGCTLAATSGDGVNFTSTDTVTLTSVAEINEL